MLQAIATSRWDHRKPPHRVRSLWRWPCQPLRPCSQRSCLLLLTEKLCDFKLIDTIRFFKMNPSCRQFSFQAEKHFSSPNPPHQKVPFQVRTPAFPTWFTTGSGLRGWARSQTVSYRATTITLISLHYRKGWQVGHYRAHKSVLCSG